MKTLVLIGDYVRKDYEPYVRELLAGVVEIKAPEENCRDSRVVLAHLDEWALAARPDIVHINCGLHDLKREFGQAQHAVPIDDLYGATMAAGRDRMLLSDGIHFNHDGRRVQAEAIAAAVRALLAA